MKSVSPEASARDGRWDIAAAVFCFLFGLALIANVHPNGDGFWFWYAHSMLQGHKIYTDLHLNLQPLFVLCTEAFMKLLGTVLLTGDSIAAWRLESITRASKIKGGTGPILFSPLTMPWRLLKTLLHPQGAAVVVGVLLLWVLFWRYPTALERGRRLRTSIDALVFAVFAAVSAYAAWQGATGLVNEKLGQAGGFLLVLAGLWAQWQLLQWLRGARTEPWHRRLVLLLVPFWSLMGGTLTSGKFLPAYDADAAVLLLIAALAIPSVAAVRWQRRSLLALCVVIVIAFLPEKIEKPYRWMHYSDGPLFVGRTLYHHPVWGPMVIETRQLAFIQPMCDLIDGGAGGTTLLATPYPYPNYFCNVPPWHGYVQTWYDTSSKETIDALDQALLAAPPRWILYQRGLDTMGIQEASLGNRRQVPQRAMDREFMNMIEGRQWTVARRVCFEGSDWILMRTTPPAAGEHEGTTADEADPCAGSPDN